MNGIKSHVDEPKKEKNGQEEATKSAPTIAILWRKWKTKDLMAFLMLFSTCSS
jgi:hypothetical protein